tara:strand:+ start:347 stop:529 length:183 start_codon:yes stop_codon:yes gene_type:complete
MSQFIDSQISPQPVCIKCKNFIKETKCKAFNIIPNEILFGNNKHSKPFKTQKNNIIFEEK